MKINFSQALKALDGTPISRLDGKGEFTLKFVSQEALLLSFQDEQGLGGEEKTRRWVLATMIEANPEKIDLTSEQIALIKKLIGKAYGPLIVGQAWELLEAGVTG